MLLVAGSGRDRLEVEAVILLAEDRAAETTLAELRTRVRGVDDPATRRAFDSAIAMLEHNLAGQRDLAGAVQQSRRSRRRLVDATVVERRALRRRLSERARPLLPQIDALLCEVSSSDPATAGLLTQCRAEVIGIGGDLDVLADGLHPARLTELGLAAVEEMLSGGPVTVHVRLPRRRYPAEVEAAIWYTCAEAVTNAAKHGHATGVWIDGGQDGGWLAVEIRDDGAGGAVLSKGGGLSGLADRIAGLDGMLSVDSEPGRGTTVRVQVPAP